MALAPLPPLLLGDLAIALARPSLSARITLASTWAKYTPDGEDAQAPLAVQQLLSFAALGLCWDAARTVPSPWAPRTLASLGFDLLAFGEMVSDALEPLAAVAGHVNGPALASFADRVAWDLIATTYPPTPKVVQDKADFLAAEPAPGSSLDSSPPIAGSATPSAGAT